MPNWAEQAIKIAQRFDALIIPLYSKNQPGTKLNIKKYPDLPPNKLPSSDPDIIRKWATYHPGYGVVPTKNFIIVDIDVKEDQNGKASLKFLTNHGLPTDTFVVKSPSGGLHLYYRTPGHYIPGMSTGKFITIKFEDVLVQAEWDDMQLKSGKESTGVDTRFGFGYAVGPGSNFDGASYVLMSDRDLASIPLSMQIGAKDDTVRATSPKKPQKSSLEEIEPGSISTDRNEHAKTHTYKLSKMGLDEVVAKAYINNMVSWYNNDDGEAPTFDIIWDMYVRALDKRRDDDNLVGEDILDHMLDRYVYITTGKRVYDSTTQRVDLFDDLVPTFSNQNVFLPGSDKPINPIKAWLVSPERKTASALIFDIRYPHGIFQDKYGAMYYNMFNPPTPLPLGTVNRTEYGDRMFDAVMAAFENVVPDVYEREYFLAWIALLIFKPSHRLAWHWHIYSDVHGVGKDTLADAIVFLYGQENTKRLNPSVFLDKSNTDLYNTGLAIMSDFSALKRKGEALQRYKELTGSSFGSERRLYADAEQSAISVRFLLLTNHEQDFPIEKQDRRTFKSHCKSPKLDEEIGGLVKALVGEPVSPEVMFKYDVHEPTPEDVIYCKSKLYHFLAQTKYDQLPHDCPSNRTKEESLVIDIPVYMEEFIRLIQARSFIFASDIVTEETIRIMAISRGVRVSIGTIMTNLLEAGIIHRIEIWRSKSDKSRGKTAKIINERALEYDRDLDQIYEIGDKFPQKCYCVRNVDYWLDIDGRDNKRLNSEYRKIINYPGISIGYDAERAEKFAKSNVVNLHDSSK